MTNIKVVKDGETLFEAIEEEDCRDYYSKDPDPLLQHTFTAYLYNEKMAAFEDHMTGKEEVYSETDLAMIGAAMDEVIDAS